MWLKAFQTEEGKLLSESELWILTLVGDNFESPAMIMDRLLERTREWTPKPGTVYPILHRLTDAKLLDKIEDGGLSFKRSNTGRLFLSSITKPLRAQLSETLNFYQDILRNLANLEDLPARYDQFLVRLAKRMAKIAKRLSQLGKEVREKADKAHDVPITFED
jgi:DNA-binding PadR family transcriptional regulator